MNDDDNDKNKIGNVNPATTQGLVNHGRLTRFDRALRSFLDDLKAINRAFLLTTASIDDAGKEPSKQFAKALAKYTPKSELNNLIEIFRSASKEGKGNENLSVTLSVPPSEIKIHKTNIEEVLVLCKQVVS